MIWALSMNKVFLIMMFIGTSFLYSQKGVECISLGRECSTAAAFQAFKLRNAAYPFDWVISSFAALYSVISDDFKDYLNPQYFRIREDNHGVINKYGIVFVHDFPTIHYTGNNIAKEDIVNESILSPQWLNALPLIQNKYERRINRFIEICDSKNKVYFFRHFGIARHEAIQLRNLIELKYPHLDFVLVVVGNHSAYAKQWGERKIKNYYLNDTQIWNDVREWQRILNDLDILSSVRISLQFLVEEYTKNLCGHCWYCQSKKAERT